MFCLNLEFAYCRFFTTTPAISSSSSSSTVYSTVGATKVAGE